MPKLIIKQEVATSARKRSLAKWLSIGGLLTLLLTVAAAAAYFTNKPLPTSDLEPLTFESAAADTAGYQSLQSILGDLMAEYAGLAERGLDDYQKNLMLSGKAESILTHLDKMSGAAEQLGLNAEEYREVADRHQFYNDFWQAKLHFRQLRISRFENTAINNLSDANSPLDEPEQPIDKTLAVVEQPVKKKFQFAKPPAGMEMPAGFCDLSNPESCKAEGEPALKMVDEDVDNQQPQPKKKFQFAKPPAGMEMPAGFCDLSNPEGCKAEDGASEEMVVQNVGDLPLPSEVQDESIVGSGGTTEKPGKRKFQFAKPPEGMELPTGFCDLSNPASCKKEGDLLSDADQPALDIVVEPESNGNKDQL